MTSNSRFEVLSKESLVTWGITFIDIPYAKGNLNNYLNLISCLRSKLNLYVSSVLLHIHKELRTPMKDTWTDYQRNFNLWKISTEKYLLPFDYSIRKVYKIAPIELVFSLLRLNSGIISILEVSNNLLLKLHQSCALLF